jgi:NADH dehydrogenase
VRITIIDQRNHHLFQPLLYQTATALLAPSEIAWPIRWLLRRRKDVTTLLGEVVGVDAPGKRVLLKDGEGIAYDLLVLATGAQHSYFGHDEWAPYAPGLKTLEDATAIRGRILSAFEKAEREDDEAKRRALLTFVVVGAGPTGVEMAGTITEIARETLRTDFRRIDTKDARIVLIEAGPRILPSFDADLAAYAHRALESLGVQIELGRPVRDCNGDGVVFDTTLLPAKTIIWAAGVAASPAAAWLGAPADRAGRVKVLPDLTVPDNPDIFVIGDTATIEGEDGKPVPGIAPAAKQEGRYVANTIRARLAGEPSLGPFRYHDAGSLATIGKSAAIIDFGWIKFRGWIAWMLWGLAHIYFLIGVRNRLAVALNWFWIYLTGARSARLITQADAAVGAETPR